MRILIAEDSRIIQEKLSEMISRIPTVQIVGFAQDGMEAIQAIHQLRPDWVLLDLHMPNLNGFGVLQDMMKHDGTTKAMVLTNFSNDLYRKKCTDLGVKYFFDKAAEFDQAIAVIESISKCSHEVHSYG